MKAATGFTLIELLVSITLGMVLLTMGATALVQISKVAKRDTAQRQAHDEIAIMHRRLAEGLNSLYHPSQIRLEAYRGPDGKWDTGDEWISLIWMSSMRDKGERFMHSDSSFSRELQWNQLIWKGNPELDSGGEVLFARSTERQPTELAAFEYEQKDLAGNVIKPNLRLQNSAQWRRDRRRDLDDNDMRWVPGMRKTLWQDSRIQALVGDRRDLWDNLKPMLAPATEVANMTIEWVDAGGVVVRGSPVDGISIDGGSLLGQPWSGKDIEMKDHPTFGGTDPILDPTTCTLLDVHVIDGAFMDGRASVNTGAGVASRLSLAERPSLIRIHLMLVPKTHSGLDLDDEPHIPFSLTIPVGPSLPALR